jgi:predicted transcriptional regulator
MTVLSSTPLPLFARIATSVAARVLPSSSLPALVKFVAIRRHWIEIVPVRGQVETMSAKQILLEVAEKLPPDATISDAIYELEFRQAVQQGLDELDRGEGVPIEEVKAKIAQWAGK